MDAEFLVRTYAENRRNGMSDGKAYREARRAEDEEREKERSEDSLQGDDIRHDR